MDCLTNGNTNGSKVKPMTPKLPKKFSKAKTVKNENGTVKKPRAKSLDNRKKSLTKRKVIKDESRDSYELDMRDTNTHGLVKDHKNPAESGTY